MMMFNTSSGSTNSAPFASSEGFPSSLFTSAESSISLASLRTEFIHSTPSLNSTVSVTTHLTENDATTSTDFSTSDYATSFEEYHNSSRSDDAVVVSPSTIWIPNTSTSVSVSQDSESDMFTLVSIGTTMRTSVVTSTVYPNDYTQQNPTTDVSNSITQEVSVVTPVWLKTSTEVPSSETAVLFTRNYIFTDSSTTFTKGLPTLTVIPTSSTFSRPTEPVVTDSSFYRRWLSGALDSEPSTNPDMNRNKIIGGVIGSVAGVAALLVILSLMFRKRRKRNLIEHEKTFSHEIGRKMGYDEIENYLPQRPVTAQRSAINSTSRLQTKSSGMYQSTKQLPTTPSHIQPPPKHPHPIENPFTDGNVISSLEANNTQARTRSVNSYHSSLVTSSTVDDDVSSTTLSSNRNTQPFLTEIIED